ncbi:MAG: hypothetical protein ABI451_02445 [Dokdonella sp.]
MTARQFPSGSALFLASCVVLLACLLAHGGSALAAIFTVGTGAGCMHGTIQSAINAANAAPGADTVRLTRSLTYEPEADIINASENLNLVGGFATCTQAATDSIKTVVSGAGGAADPVFRIFAGTGIVVKLRHLTITLGDEDGGGGGGGILFQGNGSLEIIESTITNNSAAYGGGIYAFGTGPNAELIISDGTVISNNKARYSGGGVSIAGPIEMTMTAPNSIISFNQALGQLAGTGYGGGLQVGSEAIAYIGTSGVGSLGAIYANSAIDGGGISIVSGAGDGADAVVHLFTTNSLLPVFVRQNYASDTGGGVYLQSYSGATSSSVGRLCAWDFRFEENEARDGSAIYLNSDDYFSDYRGGEVRLNDPTCTHPGAVRCASGVACNTISRNNAVNIDGGPSDGATLRLLDGARLYAYRFDMRGNRAHDAIRMNGNLAYTMLEDCLLADNELTQQLIRTEGSFSFASVVGCTIARNLIASRDLLHIEYSLDLRETIIDQPGKLTLEYSGPGGSSLVVANVLASDIITLPTNSSIISGDPSFIDAANGNYRLQQYSLATDFASPVGAAGLDLDNLPRDQDLPGVPNMFGVRDLGAYERQIGAGDCGAADTIFCDRFEP